MFQYSLPCCNINNRHQVLPQRHRQTHRQTQRQTHTDRQSESCQEPPAGSCTHYRAVTSSTADLKFYLRHTDRQTQRQTYRQLSGATSLFQYSLPCCNIINSRPEVLPQRHRQTHRQTQRQTDSMTNRETAARSHQLVPVLTTMLYHHQQSSSEFVIRVMNTKRRKASPTLSIVT